jgi:hypothetical protein
MQAMREFEAVADPELLTVYISLSCRVVANGRLQLALSWLHSSIRYKSEPILRTVNSPNISSLLRLTYSSRWSFVATCPIASGNHWSTIGECTIISSCLARSDHRSQPNPNKVTSSTSKLRLKINQSSTWLFVGRRWKWWVYLTTTSYSF